MKKYLILLSLCIITSYLNAQPFITSESTTEAEYNYMVKGYKTQLEQGLDIKQGYTVSETSEVKIGSDYTFYFTSLKRTKDNSYAGIIVKAISHSWGNTYWYGIPFKNYVLFEKFMSSMSSLDESMTKSFFKAFSYYNLSFFTDEPTSETEFNYMSKGYKTQIEQGLDMKKGYAFDDNNTKKYIITSGSLYEFEFKPLLRSNKTQTGTIVIIYSNYSQKTYYVGIPNNNTGSFDSFEGFIDSGEENFSTAFFGAYILYALNYDTNNLMSE